MYKTWCKAGPPTTIRYATKKDAQTIPAEEGMFEANAEICATQLGRWTHGTLE